MINLNEEYTLQKNKLVNIFGLHLKQTIIVSIMNMLMRNLIIENIYLEITLYLTIIMFVFNTIAAIFLLCFKREFPKLEYFLIYTMNIFIFLTVLVYSLNYFIQKKENENLLQLYIKTYIMILIEKEVEILLVKIFPLNLANRFVNCFTTSIIIMMILSHTDSYQCQEQTSTILLSLLLTNMLTTIFNVIFTLILFNQNSSQKELRNFSNIVLFVLFIVHISEYILIQLKTNVMNTEQCQSITYVFNFYKYIAPINLVAFFFVIYQEISYVKSAFVYQEMIQKNSQHRNQYSIGIIQKQQTRQSIRSLIGSVANPMEASQSNSQAPNFGERNNKGNLEKMGTSQFGNSQHNQPMIHSWANVQNPNPFGPNSPREEKSQKSQQDQLKQIESQEHQKRGSRSVDESMMKQEESQNQSLVNNPMESGSVVVIN